MKRITAPMLGGVGSALALVLIVFSAIFSFWRGRLPSAGAVRNTVASTIV